MASRPRSGFPGGEFPPVRRILGRDERAEKRDLVRVRFGVEDADATDQLEALEEEVRVGDVGLAVVADRRELATSG